MKAETRSGGCHAETKKNRAGERRNHRLTAHTLISWQLRRNDKTPRTEPALHQNPIRRCSPGSRSPCSRPRRAQATAKPPPTSDDADARAVAGAIPNAAPHAYARRLDICAVRIVRRRRDVVLWHEGLEHLRLRRPQTQTLQSQEHGRSENSTRGLPIDVRHVLIPYP